MYSREYEKDAAQLGDTGTGFEQEKADLIRAARGGDRVKTFLESVDTRSLHAGPGSAKVGGVAHSRSAEDEDPGRAHERGGGACRGEEEGKDAGRKRSRSNSASGW